MPRSPPANTSLPALSVLLVDDDEYVLVAMRSYLPSPPIQASVAVNGRAALEAVMADPPDAVVMDLDMPVMGGYEAAARIRAWEDSTGQERRVLIAMSAHDDPLVGERCLDAGFDRFLVKPVTGEELRRVLSVHTMPAADHVVQLDGALESVLPGFIASRRALLEDLSRALDESHAGKARAIAHKLAGAFALYGFLWASGHSRMIELRAKGGALEGLSPQVDALTRHLDTVQLEFRRRREGDPRD